jgi:hypothetical protein
MRPARRRISRMLPLVVGGIAACQDRGITPPPAETLSAKRDILVSAELLARADWENRLAIRVAVTLDGADSARVIYRAGDDRWLESPAKVTSGSRDTLLALGLRPTTVYEYRVVAYDGDTDTSAVASFRTDALPDAIANVRLQRVNGTAAHFVLTGSGSYAVAMDTSGSIVWYRDFTSLGLPVSDVAIQPNGHYTAYLGASTGWQPVPGYYVEFRPDGEIVRTYKAPPGSYVDDHEIQLTGSGADMRAHYFTYDIRPMDLSDVGGPSQAQVAGHQVVRQRASTGAIEFSWNGWERLHTWEWIGDDQLKPRIATDYDHPNSLTFDPKGNYVVSWRNLDQVMAIDPATGAVLWRVGGVLGEYKFVGDWRNGFRKQHSAHVLANGNLLLFDNGSDLDPLESRAAEYRLDHAAKTATLVWEYRHPEGIYSQFVGNVKRFANGNTWVSFGFVGRVVEVSPSGALLFDAQLMASNGYNGTAYRLVPAKSLYGVRAE